MYVTLFHSKCVGETERGTCIHLSGCISVNLKNCVVYVHRKPVATGI